MVEGDGCVGAEGVFGEGDFLASGFVGEGFEGAEEFVVGGIDGFDGHYGPWNLYSDASLARAWARTRVPWRMSVGAAYSSGRWETPLRQGMKIMAMGAMGAMKRES